MIGVNLKPTALYKITGMDACRFTDKGIPAQHIWHQQIIQLQQQLQQEANDAACITLLNNFFLSLIKNKNITINNFDQLIDIIIQKQGNITENEIFKMLPVSERTLQRYFKKQLGVSLKTYIRILRNLNLFKKITQNPDIPFLDIIYSLGYFDYSHFIKDFKKMTGHTPKQYFSSKQEFAHILTQL